MPTGFKLIEFWKSGNKIARALKLGTVRDLFASARKGFMTKRILRHGCQDMIDLIATTYVKSLKVTLPLSHTC